MPIAWAQQNTLLLPNEFSSEETAYMRINRLLAALTTVSIAGFGCALTAMPVNAVELLSPLYPPLHETDSFLLLRVGANIEFTMTVYQHSEEREALVMYALAETTDDETSYCCTMLEAGEYTLEISVPAISGCRQMLTQELQFTIVNPDYAEDYTASKITVDLQKTMDPTLEIGFSDTELTAYVDGTTQIMKTAFLYNSAEGLCGDVNLDGVIDSQDAIDTLQAYVADLLGQPADMTTQQMICADIDGNRILDTNDALCILEYYAQTILGEQPTWEDIL